MTDEVRSEPLGEVTGGNGLSRRRLLQGAATAFAAAGWMSAGRAVADAAPAITPFTYAAPESALDDLKRRLAHARFPEAETADDWAQGVPLARLRALVEYWRTGYDWRRCEALLNAFAQYRTKIEGLARISHRKWVHRGSEPAITLLSQRLKLAQRSFPMPTECSGDLFGFAPVEGRRVEAAFDGGDATSDAGAVLLGATDRAIGLVDRFAACFQDGRTPALVEHSVPAMVAQRVFGIALGDEDLVDHDQLRHDPVLATLAGKLQARRKDCAPLAGKSTLNRLEHAVNAERTFLKSAEVNFPR